MSNREKIAELLKIIPDYKIGYVLAYVQGLAADEKADLVETSPDKKGSPDIKSIKRFNSIINLSTNKKANAYITVKESTQYGHKIYSLELR